MKNNQIQWTINDPELGLFEISDVDILKKLKKWQIINAMYLDFNEYKNKYPNKSHSHHIYNHFPHLYLSRLFEDEEDYSLYKSIIHMLRSNTEETLEVLKRELELNNFNDSDIEEKYRKPIRIVETIESNNDTPGNERNEGTKHTAPTIAQYVRELYYITALAHIHETIENENERSKSIDELNKRDHFLGNVMQVCKDVISYNVNTAIEEEHNREQIERMLTELMRQRRNILWKRSEYTPTTMRNDMAHIEDIPEPYKSRIKVWMYYHVFFSNEPNSFEGVFDRNKYSEQFISLTTKLSGLQISLCQLNNQDGMVECEKRKFLKTKLFVEVETKSNCFSYLISKDAGKRIKILSLSGVEDSDENIITKIWPQNIEILSLYDHLKKTYKYCISLITKCNSYIPFIFPNKRIHLLRDCIQQIYPSLHKRMFSCCERKTFSYIYKYLYHMEPYNYFEDAFTLYIKRKPCRACKPIVNMILSIFPSSELIYTNKGILERANGFKLLTTSQKELDSVYKDWCYNMPY